MTKEINFNERISWNSTDFFLIRDGKLVSLSSKSWRDINKGEKYCHILQTPSTPPDFGLMLMERTDLKEVEGLGLVPFDDKYLIEVTNFDYINPTDIQDFILENKKFHNYYNTK